MLDDLNMFLPIGGIAAGKKIAEKLPKKDPKDQKIPRIARQTKVDSTENISSKLKNTVRDIQGTPAEIAADKKRAEAAKAKNVPKPKRKPKVPTSTEKSSNPEVYVDSSVTYDMDNMPKKMSGGKVNYRKAGGKIGRGCGAAMRGAGKVMKT